MARRPAFAQQSRGFMNVGDKITNFAQDRKTRKERACQPPLPAPAAAQPAS